MAGHAHRVFPRPDYAMLPGADFKAGKIKGVPVTMAGFWARISPSSTSCCPRRDALAGRRKHRRGCVRSACREGTAWGVKRSLIPRSSRSPAGARATLAYVRRPVGKDGVAHPPYFALVQDDPSCSSSMTRSGWFVRGR